MVEEKLDRNKFELHKTATYHQCDLCIFGRNKSSKYYNLCSKTAGTMLNSGGARCSNNFYYLEIKEEDIW